MNHFRVKQLRESVRMKTAAAIDNLNRYSGMFRDAVSVRIAPMCICRSARTVRTIGS
ncbi:hypothetical protein BN2475_190263 [Paraburkholderia ribeironis]|uniref:Uncharacterized protein n=1 Tax=Paraburkholderia ribeironis TaxID=1247936 RepID=A0A1N7RWE5_9BURK|nr:hypothetical protein BN2475_190263 [Paraburkholderia ribeironis]